MQIATQPILKLPPPATECDLLLPSRFDCYHTKGRPLTLGRVVTAVFFQMLEAKEEFQHWEDLWLALTDYEKAVKGKTEPRLLTR